MLQTSFFDPQLPNSEFVSDVELAANKVLRKPQNAGSSPLNPHGKARFLADVVRTYYYLGAITFERQEYNLAIAWFERIIALEPHHLQAHLALAAIFNLQDETAKGQLMWAKAAKITIESINQQQASLIDFHLGDSYYRLGKMHYREGNHQLAHKCWQQAVTCCPENPDFNYQLAQSLENNQDLAAAIERYQKTIAVSPSYWQAYFSLGNIFAQQEEWQLALSAYLKVQQLQPGNFWAYNNAGNVYSELRQWQQAQNHYLKALSCKHYQAHTGWCYYYLGTAYFQMDQWEQALSSYRQAQTILQAKSDVSTRIAQVQERQEYIKLAISSAIA